MTLLNYFNTKFGSELSFNDALWLQLECNCDLISLYKSDVL